MTGRRGDSVPEVVAKTDKWLCVIAKFAIAHYDKLLGPGAKARDARWAKLQNEFLEEALAAKPQGNAGGA